MKRHDEKEGKNKEEEEEDWGSATEFMISIPAKKS